MWCIRVLHRSFAQHNFLPTRRLSILSNVQLGKDFVKTAITFAHRRCISTQEDEAIRQELLQYQGGSVDLHKDDDTGIACIVLNHEDKKNALSGKMMVDMRDTVEELEQWKNGKGVLFYGAGGTFCSGGDLQLMKDIADPISGGKMCQFMQATTSRLARLPLLSLAVINGRSLGGGAELAVACDFRVMSENAKIGFVQTRMGISPGWGCGARLVQLVGPTLALELLASGRVLNCSEALGMGLVSGVVRGDYIDTEPPEQARIWLQQLTKAEPAAIQAAKRVVTNALYSHNSEEMLANEKDVFTSVWGGPIHLNAISNNIKHD